MTPLPGDFPEVDRMPDKVWERIEDQLFERLDREPLEPPNAFASIRPRRRWLPIAGFACAAAAAAVLAFVWSSGSSGPAPSQPLAASRVVTDDDSSTVTLGGASLDVAPASAVVMSGDDERGMLVVLERGAVDCAVPPREGRPPFVVHAGDVEVRVVGTKFTVARDGDSAMVEVTKGTVEVIADGDRALVQAGEVWWRPVEDEYVEDDADIADEDEADAGADEVSVAPVVRKPPRRKRRRRKARVEPKEHAPVVAAPAPAGPTRAERYNDAARIEATDPGRAIAAYRELARGRDTWAGLALFAHARLEADRGNKSRARRLLADYLSRFPRGANAEDARELQELLK